MDASTLECGREYPPDGEENAIASLAALHLKVHQAQPGPALRGEHPKQHAGLWATFHVDDTVPESMRVGLFAAPGSYPALIRFSNGRTVDDRQPDVRGMALKVLVPDGTGTSMQDFITADHPVFFARNVQDLLSFLMASVSGTPIDPGAYPQLAGFTRVATTSLLATTYWSQTPYKLGGAAVKYVITPSPDQPPFAGPAGGSADWLRDAIAAQLTTGNGGARFEFSVQVQTDAASMPIEDPTIEWTSSPVRVATISIEPQVFGSPAQNAFFENLAWSPWHALAEHRPLGGINRARRRIYRESSALRHRTLGTAPAIPIVAALEAR